jgi:hypothetical protein
MLIPAKNNFSVAKNLMLIFKYTVKQSFFSVASASAELGHIFYNVMLFCRFSCVFRLIFWVAFRRVKAT